MGVLDDEFTPGTTQATTPVTPAGPSTPSTVTADASSSSSFTVSTTPTAIDASSSSSTSTATASTAEIATPEIPEEKKPTFTIKGNAAARGIGNVDSRLVAIMEKAAAETPYSVEVFSGLRYGSSTGSRHNSGNAVDVVLIDANGNEVPNLKSSTGFPIYRDFALKAREIQERDYPELNDAFRWGGGFSGGRGTYGSVDLMHFDIKPGGSMGGIAGGSLGEAWAGGLKLTPAQERIVAGMGPGQIYSSRGIGRPAGNVQFADFSGRGRNLGSPTAYASAGEPGGAAAAAANLAASVPDPRPRPDTTSPAFGARGASELQGQLPSIIDVGAVVIDGGRAFGKGEEGDHVAALQEFLNWRGVTDYYGNALVVDGKMGRLTRQAVKAYQTVSQIGVDGKVGPETYQAMLYDINPGAAVMPGKAAYQDGAAAARPIVDPASTVPMPRPRPSRDEAVPIPRTRADFYALRLTRSAHYRTRYGDLPGLTKAETSFTPLPGEQPVEMPSPAANATVDEGRTARREALIELATMRARQGVGSQVFSEGQTGIPFTDPIVRDQAARQERYRQMVAENDAYFGTDSPDLPDPLADRGTRESRAIDRAQAMLLSRKVVEEGDSAAASDLAMRQRFADANAGGDALRIMPDAEVSFGPTLVRTAEAIREFVRGLGDSYRRAIAQRQGLAPYDPFGTKSSTKDQSRLGGDPPDADAVLRADPTPSGAVTSIYSFGPGPVTRKQRIDDRAKRLAE